MFVVSDLNESVVFTAAKVRKLKDQLSLVMQQNLIDTQVSKRRN